MPPRPLRLGFARRPGFGFARRLAALAGLVAFAVLASSLSDGRAPGVAGQVPYSDLYVPMGMLGVSLPLATPQTLPPPTPTLTRTPTTTPTLIPTRTPTEPPTPGPSPTPTRPGGEVSYPKDPETIVMQLGWSATEQPGAAWEEMNGTPWFTLYGDRRLVAGHSLFAWRQPLYSGMVAEADIQEWLQHLTYDIGFFTMDAEYDHPDYVKFALHLYVRYSTGARDYKRMTIGGFTRWLRDPLPDTPDAPKVRQVAQLVKAVEDYCRANLSEPFTPESYTIISHEVNPYLVSAPSWPHRLDIAAISDSAPPNPGGGNVHGPPGHQVADAALGSEIRGLVAIDAARDWPGLNEAAEYVSRGRHFIVGARQEVAGGSPFLPDGLRNLWYRSD